MSGPAAFQPTRWSLIAAIRSNDADEGTRAREQLCTAYWYPLYAYIRRSGHSPEESSDLTQAFFARICEKDLFALAQPDRGRLRTFLLTALQHFLQDEWRKGQRVKRGAGVEWLSIDEVLAEERYALEPADPKTPEAIYERRWALELLERTLLAVRQDYVKRGKAELFDSLKGSLTADDADEAHGANGPSTANSPAKRVANFRLRQRYREQLLREVAASLDANSQAEVEEEINALFRALG